MSSLNLIKNKKKITLLPSFDINQIQQNQVSTENFRNSRSRGLLTITGRWRFYNRNDNLTSTYLLVQIVKNSDNTVLASCYTDMNGYYSCGPFNNPSVAVRSQFITYANESTTGNTLVTVNPDVGTTGTIANAYMSAGSASTFADGTHDIGSEVISNGNTNERAYWIMQDLINVWLYIWNETGSSQSPQESAGSATVEWKSGGTTGNYYSIGGNIHLTGTAPLSNTVVGHEYGHNIMHTVYSVYPTSYCPSPHYMTLSSHVNCAWTEGWANFLPLAVNNDPVYRWDTGTSQNLETPTWGTPGWDNGDDVEGRVAGALWDIIDNANDGDDTYTDGDITNIWDTFYHQDDNNFAEYTAAWISRGHPIDGPDGCLLQNTISY
ncbi:hypothetical protein THII_0188 [Thioploca ingrica]|uniref:Peptidase M4 C-terminal domain-containing protein n=1 Tax=Thioploca ingrica TaxID=40754 RepID=A0A090AI69_9GAMM|nr:hypothetical protein THII_0188 [Thioploca ingrica]